MSLSKEQLYAIDNLSLMRPYYESTTQADMEPERVTALSIMDYVSGREHLSEEDFTQIEALYNVICTQEHYNGSGWMDFKMRLGYLLLQFSKEAQWDRRSGRLVIQDKAAPTKTSWWKFH